MQINLPTIIFLCILTLSGTAQAELHDRGGGLLYDDVLDVTWLQDANYAGTTGYGHNGKMDWSEAHAWVSKLVYHDSVRNVDYTGWRLPKNRSVGGFFESFDGLTDEGWNITRPGSELAYMYYVNLGLKGFYNPVGDFTVDFGVFGLGQYIEGQRDVGLVRNLQSSAYWYGNFSKTPDAVYIFITITGDQSISYRGSNYVWPVHDGDIAPALEVNTTQEPEVDIVSEQDEDNKTQQNNLPETFQDRTPSTRLKLATYHMLLGKVKIGLTYFFVFELWRV